MEWYQVLTIIVAVFGSIFGLFIWTNNKIDKVKEEVSERTREIIKEIRDSNLDFHGRLCSIEASKTKKAKE
jgi:predicted secreted Zn-dependent protease